MERLNQGKKTKPLTELFVSELDKKVESSRDAASRDGKAIFERCSTVLGISSISSESCSKDVLL